MARASRFLHFLATAVATALLAIASTAVAADGAITGAAASKVDSQALLPTLEQRGEPRSYSKYRQERAQKELVAKRFALEKELEKIAVIERKVMIPMRDGKRMAADIYRPKNADGKVPIILVRTPYNFNFWDVKLGAPSDMSRQLEAVKRGYAYVIAQERGHFFSEGNYEILGAPRTDGYDLIKWLTSQPWSNGKLAPTGCSSTAEWQSAVVAMNPPGLASFNPQGFGAGVGRVGPYYEQGNWFRGGAMQMLFIDWIYRQQNQVRPMLPADATQEQRIQASKMFDLAPQMPPINWSKAFRHLPVSDIIKAVGGPPGVFATEMPVPTGGNMIARTPNDPAWYTGGLWNDSMPIEKPGLWFMSWFDVSMSPNLAEYHYVRRTAPADVADQQYLVIAPVLHCAYTRAEEQTMIGDLNVGDARYDYKEYMYDWFDHFLKGEDNGVLKKHPKVMYYLMGKNKWKDSPSWPPPGTQSKTFYLHSGGSANTLYGNGSLAATPPAADHPDRFVYDPANPVPTFGAAGCCQADAVEFGSFDQREHETRNDILVYDTPAFEEGVEVSGPITVTLYVSSDAKDTDFTFKIMDVYPDGRAFNLVSNIQRMRWREGYEHGPVWMKQGEVYKVTFQPIDISNYFFPGHKLRIAISSSNFPRFDRNLNTGANNETTTKMVIAHNVVHHSKQYPSHMTLTVLP
ncbi:MAG TPA: CocE/NonD family hydrolase, partial [Gammaproteobacteria bacterium]|nr:CocE/NonD family hydrolase [Gammaproteobacteria bacterium]